MSTSVEFALHSDDPGIRDAVADMNVHSAEFWRLAMFCCQIQLEKAIRRDAVRDHYNTIHMRAKATREAKRDQGND